MQPLIRIEAICVNGKVEKVDLTKDGYLQRSLKPLVDRFIDLVEVTKPLKEIRLVLDDKE